MLCVTFLYLLDLVFAKSIYQRQLVHLFSLVTWSRKKAKAVKDENNTGKKFWNLTDRNLIVFENHAQGQIFFIEKETTSVKFCIAFKIFPWCDNFISFFYFSFISFFGCWYVCFWIIDYILNLSKGQSWDLESHVKSNLVQLISGMFAYLLIDYSDTEV